MTTVYLGTDDNHESYIIGETDFIPSFLVRVYHSVPGDTEINYYWTPNNQQYFDVYYEKYDVGKNTTERIEAILCTQYIENWDQPNTQK